MTNCLSVFDHFVKLALKGLSAQSFRDIFYKCLFLNKHQGQFQSAQLKLSTNLSKWKRKIFVINFGENFENYFLILVKHLLAWHFLLFLFF